MSTPIQIRWKDVQPHEEVISEIDQAYEKLCLRFSNTSHFHVVIARPSGQHKDENRIAINLDTHLAGKDFVVSQTSTGQGFHGSYVTAVRSAFGSLTDQMASHVDRRLDSQHRGHDEPHDGMGGGSEEI